MGSSGGGGTNTVTQANPPPQFMAAYQNVVNQAQKVASQPYQAYPGGASSMVAGFSPDQLAGMQTIEKSQGIANPYINAGAQYMNNATTPLWGNTQQFSPSAVSQYESPFTQQVVGATQQQFANLDAQQQNQLTGSAASQGALGGDRLGVAQGVMAGQQAAAQAPVLAGLENQGYTQGLGEFNTQQQAQLGANEANAWLNSQAGFGMAGLGTQAQNATLSGANALMGAGAQQQGLAQEKLNIPYEQYLAHQAYPFQTTGWLGNIAEGLGSQAGGSSTSTTNVPAPSVASGIGGAAVGAAGLLGQTGAFGSSGWLSNAFSSGAGGLNPSVAAPVMAAGGSVPHRFFGGGIGLPPIASSIRQPTGFTAQSNQGPQQSGLQQATNAIGYARDAIKAYNFLSNLPATPGLNPAVAAPTAGPTATAALSPAAPEAAAKIAESGGMAAKGLADAGTTAGADALAVDAATKLGADATAAGASAAGTTAATGAGTAAGTAAPALGAVGTVGAGMDAAGAATAAAAGTTAATLAATGTGIAAGAGAGTAIAEAAPLLLVALQRGGAIPHRAPGGPAPPSLGGGALPAGITIKAPSYAGGPGIPMLPTTTGAGGIGAPASGTGGLASSAMPASLAAYLANTQAQAPTQAQLAALQRPFAPLFQPITTPPDTLGSFTPAPPGTPGALSQNTALGMFPAENQAAGGVIGRRAEGGMADTGNLPESASSVGIGSAAPQGQGIGSQDGQEQTFGIPVAASTPLASGDLPAAPGWGRELMDVGAGIMAGRSPYALQNVGTGILAGERQFGSEKDAADRLLATVGTARARLQQESNFQNQHLGIARGTAADTASYHKGQLSVAQQRAADQAAYHKGQLSVAQQRTADQTAYQQGRLGVAGGNETERSRHDRATEGTAAQNAASLTKYRDLLTNGMGGAPGVAAPPAPAVGKNTAAPARPALPDLGTFPDGSYLSASPITDPTAVTIPGTMMVNGRSQRVWRVMPPTPGAGAGP